MYRINKDKSIGRVLYIVEGSKMEFSLLRKIYCDILGFEYIEKRRNRPAAFVSKNNSHSKVAVINTKESNIKDIVDGDDYLDEMYSMLIDEYDFPVDKAAIFYLFDRDPESNRDVELIRKLIETLQNPYDNDLNRPGMLLLSYPSIEAFIISAFDENANNYRFRLGKDCKQFISENGKVIQLNKFDEKKIINAVANFELFVREICEDIDIDNFGETSAKIFNEQEKDYINNEGFKLFSMLVLSLLQLGIIDEEDS